MVRFEKTPEGNLRLVRAADVDVTAIDPDAELIDWIEWHLCNGWEWIAPEEIGALTDTPILTDECERDDHGTITRLGRVYAHTRYAIEDAAEQLRTTGVVELQGFGPEGSTHV